MRGPVYQGNYNDLLLNYGHDKAKAIMQWYNFADGWKLNDTLGLIASPDMDVISNPYIGVSLDKYNEIYQDRRSLDPYQNKDTGWIWNSDKGAYYWPSLPRTDIDGNTTTHHARHLRPGEEKKSHGMFGSFSPALSFFTGGLSDLVGGKKLGEGLLGEQGASLFQDFVLSTGTAGLSDAYRGYQKYKDTGDIWAGADRLIDPGGVVDYGTRKIGSFLPDKIRQYAPELGTIIGSVIYPVAGTAAGYGIGAKLKGAEDNYDYKGDFIGAGTAAALAYLGQQAGGLYSQTAGQAAARTTDAELQYILNDMQAALKPGYMGTLSAGVTDPELQYILDDMESAVKPGYSGDLDAASISGTNNLQKQLLKTAAKQGIKYLTNSLAESLAPTAVGALFADNAANYSPSQFSQTGNNWATPDSSEVARAQAAAAQQEKQKIIKKQLEEKQFQPWLEKWREPYKEYMKLLQIGDIKEDFTKPKQFLSDYV